MSQESMKLAIQAVITEMMERIMNKVIYEDPFNMDKFQAIKPLYAALVPTEIFKGSHFERRFVTPFGSAWEKLAVVAANEGIGHGEIGYQIRGVVREGRLQRITEILNRLEHRSRGGQERQRPDWEKELAYIKQGKGEYIPVTVICDVYAVNQQTGERFAFELKAPLPNSDQTKVSKEKIFKLHCMEPPQVEGAYYALPYNPYGTRYGYAWSFPARWFNMKEDKAVLIGDEFWEKIGGIGTYQAFIEAVNEIGREYKERIYREYLGIEPPAEAFKDTLH
ncbi:MAG: TdeIII family type II restriction endonuclease [Chloroflexi bacterium]|nr:TdeIII family type II restriction endonuclease [Ardenticatenaceae bacterium]MBL1131183.1 TdeIII family type II restriction endonuclease [Chloroflexota bacterium]NOG37284.1 TdeIII family type II restriction endonuclease [Chloroflexota bacterium]